MTEAQAAMLSAYLDGELNAEDRRAVEALLANDTEASAYFAAIRAASATLKPAYADAMSTPARDSLREALLRPRSPTALERLQAFAADLLRPPVLAGCAAALLAGVVLGPLVGVTSGSSRELVYASNGQVLAGKQLAGLLKSARSGEATPAGVAQASFLMKDGRYCRSFANAGSAGIACRQDGAWVVELLVNHPVAPQGDYALAGDAPELAVALQRLGVSQALDRDGEGHAITSGWK